MKFPAYKEVLIETELSKEEFKKSFSEKIGKPVKWYAAIWPFKKDPYAGSLEGDNFTIIIQHHKSSLEQEIDGTKATGTLIENGSRPRIKMKIYPPEFYHKKYRLYSFIAAFTTCWVSVLVASAIFAGVFEIEIIAIFILYILFVWGITWLLKKTWIPLLEKLANDYIQGIVYVVGEVRVVSVDDEILVSKDTCIKNFKKDSFQNPKIDIQDLINNSLFSGFLTAITVNILFMITSGTGAIESLMESRIGIDSFTIRGPLSFAAGFFSYFFLSLLVLLTVRIWCKFKNKPGRDEAAEALY